MHTRGKTQTIPKFQFGETQLEVTDQYKYLGLIFNFNGKFTKAKKTVCMKKMCINRLGSIVLKRLWKIVVFLAFEEVKSQQIKQRLRNQFRQKWEAEINQSSKCLNYRMFKSNFKIEHYLTTLTYNNRQLLARFRCRNHNLPVNRMS